MESNGDDQQAQKAQQRLKELCNEASSCPYMQRAAKECPMMQNCKHVCPYLSDDSLPPITSQVQDNGIMTVGLGP